MPICLECKRPFGPDKVMLTVFRREWTHFFCSGPCKDNYAYPKLTNRTCSREGCNNKVPEGNRMLCLHCYHNEANLGERIAWLNATMRAAWEQREEAIRLRILEKVRVYSAQDMTQQELRALVPSLQEGAV